VSGVQRQAADQFEVRWSELAGRRRRQGEYVQVDPFLVCRAITEAMAACTVRTAAGAPLLWNEYRVILAAADFEPLLALQALLVRDLEAVLAREAESRQAALIGALQVTVVADEAGELPPGVGVIRAAFVPTERLLAPVDSQMTVRFDLLQARAAAAPAPAQDTMVVAEPLDLDGAPWILRWPGGEAALPVGVTIIAGRPHPDPPPSFVALHGASARINKQQLSLRAGPSRVTIRRMPAANPVHVGADLLAPSAETEATPPVEIALSLGELVLALVGRHR
jgi:hypothetical protein